MGINKKIQDFLGKGLGGVAEQGEDSGDGAGGFSLGGGEAQPDGRGSGWAVAGGLQGVGGKIRERECCVMLVCVACVAGNSGGCV